MEFLFSLCYYLMTVVIHKKYPNLSAVTVAIRNLFEQLVPTWPPKLKTIKSIVQKIHLVNSCASTSTSKSYITGQAVKCNQSRWKIGGQCYLSSHQQSYSVKCAFVDQILQNPDSTESAGGRGMIWGYLNGEEWAPALLQGWREKSLLLLCSPLQTVSLQSCIAVCSGLYSYCSCAEHRDIQHYLAGASGISSASFPTFLLGTTLKHAMAQLCEEETIKCRRVHAKWQKEE